MTQQLTPASGREDSGLPRLRPGSHSGFAAELGSDLGVRPGESDPGRMLGGVLLLVMITIITVLALAWWLV